MGVFDWLATTAEAAWAATTRSDAAQWLASGLGLGPLDGDTPPALTDWLSRSGLAHRIVWVVPEDALSGGWRVDLGDEQDIAGDLDRRLDLQETLIDAMGAASIHGGSWIWPVTKGDDWREPITEGPHDVEAVQVICGAPEGVPVAWQNNPALAGFGRPTLLQVTMARGGQTWSGLVHTSRLAYVPGSRAAPNQRTDSNTYDVSTLGLYLAAIVDMERAWSSTASLLARLSVWWIRLKGAVAGLTGAQHTSIENRLQLLKQNVSTRSVVPLLNDDEMGWAGPSVAGARDLVTVQAERLTCIQGIPLTRFFGTPPGGLSTDDEAGRRAYDGVLARERQKMELPLLAVYAIIEGPNDARRITWPEPDYSTPIDAAQVSLIYAQRDAVLVQQVGSITADESRARFADGEEVPVPVLDAAAWEAAGAEPELPAAPYTEAPPTPDLPVAGEEESAAQSERVAQEMGDE